MEIGKRSTIAEAFVSLNKVLGDLIHDTFGKESYVVDFSPKELVYCIWIGSKPIYYKVKYSVAYGVASLDGSSVMVDKQITYEKVTTESFVKLVALESEVGGINEKIS